ncbi:hypothetical protein AB0L00_07025 [Actinoallomurus sp. NPDC052308]|uniref:hypothetical protein n=1 Tax=Actinoallomurus sp. NPDC052308 TaxID=3155530 RepID=UPI00342BC8E0
MTSLRQETTGSMTQVDLSSFFDNTGLTGRDDLSGGAFNIWRNTFPAEELPGEPPTVLGGVPFRFPDRGPSGADNVRCAGQLVPVPPGRYDWVYLVAAAERRTEDFVLLHYADGAIDPEWLRVSDFWPETDPRFGERHGLRCRTLHYPRHVQERMGPAIWRERVPVPRETPLTAIRLPDNPAVHVFAMTLLPVTEEVGAP